MSSASCPAMPLPALLLGAGGLIPFVGLALLAAAGPVASHVYWLTALSYYGAVILAFVGALHWAYAVKRGAEGREAWLQYGASVLPALLAWLSLLFPVWTGLRLQAGALLACYAFDRAMNRIDPVPSWFLRLRAALSGIAAASLLVASIV
ncbi:MAG: DUF3429 domain-containing protein [Burkholderiales bacterium]|nr:DUF3429 domain-containing protein [Burkholderiales bacterium]MDP2398289.1 DUF3429 domain-containing protein [Burkholderiales bacterium]MDP3715145.1 DUF3429 domain-containing protein [Burkholderiales bacterium]